MHIPPDETGNRLDAVGRETGEPEDLANEFIHGDEDLFCIVQGIFATST